MRLISALSKQVTEFVAYAFVDDTDLIVSARDILEEAQTTLQQLQPMVNDWDDTLFVTGGTLVPEKSFWTMIAFKWHNDGWRHMKKAELEGELTMKNPITRTPTIVQRIEPSDTKETLGVYLAGDGNNKEQIKNLREKSQKYAQCVKSGFITKYDINHALRTTIWKSLKYLILATNIS